MARSRLLKTVGVSCALVCLASPTVAVAESQQSYSPLVSLSMVASPQSQAALCPTGTAPSAPAVEHQDRRAQGCVVPLPHSGTAPLPLQAASARLGFSPLLIGFGAIGLGVLLFALLHDDDREPPPQPVSPA